MMDGQVRSWAATAAAQRLINKYRDEYNRMVDDEYDRLIAEFRERGRQFLDESCQDA